MIVTKVVLQDYGVYRGKNEFDFTTTPEHPIVLVGGVNGAGKTTLFDSIMLCLYGISVLGKRTTRKSYEKYLERKIHRYQKGTTRADHASITVQFVFFHNGKEEEYRVERSWFKEDGKIHEDLSIKRRSRGQEFGPLELVEQSHRQEFINGMIPLGIIKLFFFDGEKIVKIAEEDLESATIQESFKSLLGIELVEQLRTDLQVNMTRNLTNSDKSLRDEFERHKKEKDDTIQSTARLQEKLARKRTEMDSLHNEIEHIESNISSIGGGFASRREDLKSQITSNKLTLENIRQRIIDLCSGPLPFSMIPARLENLSLQMQQDEQIQQGKMGHKLLREKLQEVTSQMNTAEFRRDTEIPKKGMDKVIRVMKNLAGDNPHDEKPVFDFSATQASQITGIMREANTTILDSLRKDTAKYVGVAEELTKMEGSLANAPGDDEIGPLISKVGKIYSECGTLQAEIDHIEGAISSHASLQKHLDSKLRSILSSIYKNEKSQVSVELTEKIQTVLDEFIEKLRIKKIRMLEQYLLDAIGMLFHKKHLIDHISVDPHTFEIVLYRQNNHILHKDDLSKGEQQMLATAVLWALAKTSGRPLPFIIDTPLARLDESHRNSLVNGFYPQVSHQVLILSTDTEIDLQYYNMMRPYLSRSYAMDFLDEGGVTKIHEGYFWNSSGEKIVAVQ